MTVDLKRMRLNLSCIAEFKRERLELFYGESLYLVTHPKASLF
jgi:hypothetical protein